MNHFHIDKAAYKILKKERTNIDRIMLTFGVLGPIATIPQIMNIFVDRQTAGISVPSWSFYVVSSVMTLSYGIVHRLKPLIVSGALWLVVNSLVVIGCVIYG